MINFQFTKLIATTYIYIPNVQTTITAYYCKAGTASSCFLSIRDYGYIQTLTK